MAKVDELYEDVVHLSHTVVHGDGSLSAREIVRLCTKFDELDAHILKTGELPERWKNPSQVPKT